MSEIDDLLESVRPDYDAMETDEERQDAVAEFLVAYSTTDDAMSTQAIVQLLKAKAKEQDPALVTAVHKLSTNLADNLEEAGLDFDAYKKDALEKNAKIEAFAQSYGVNTSTIGDWNRHKDATEKFFAVFEKLGDVPDDKYDDLGTIIAAVKTVFPDRTGNPLKKKPAGPGVVF